MNQTIKKHLIKFISVIFLGATVLVAAAPRFNGAAPNNQKEPPPHSHATDDNVNTQNNNDLTLLHWAISYNAKDVLELLLAKGTNVNIQDNEGTAPLHFAAAYLIKDVVALLLDHGANVNIQDKYGNTPLHNIFLYDFRRLSKSSPKSTDVNTQNQSGQTSLNTDSKKDVAILLLDKGANVNIQDEIGNTPLHLAAGTNAKDVAELLLANGADVNIENKE